MTREIQLVRPVGRFDEASAEQVVAEVARCAPGVAIRVDLGAASDVQDHELALLAHGLAACGRTVTLHGLTLHHLRVLRYLGYGPGSARALVPPERGTAAAEPGAWAAAAAAHATAAEAAG